MLTKKLRSAGGEGDGLCLLTVDSGLRTVLPPLLPQVLAPGLALPDVRATMQLMEN